MAAAVGAAPQVRGTPTLQDLAGGVAATSMIQRQIEIGRAELQRSGATLIQEILLGLRSEDRAFVENAISQSDTRAAAERLATAGTSLSGQHREIMTLFGSPGEHQIERLVSALTGLPQGAAASPESAELTQAINRYAAISGAMRTYAGDITGLLREGSSNVLGGAFLVAASRLTAHQEFMNQLLQQGNHPASPTVF